MANFRHIEPRVRNSADVSRRRIQRLQQKSVSQLQLLWWSSIPSFNFMGYSKQKLDGLGNFCPPLLSMNRGTNYPSTNRVKKSLNKTPLNYMHLFLRYLRSADRLSTNEHLHLKG